MRLIQDLRYGIRMLLKNPGFTAIAVITLALGIGANTAIFNVVNTALLKPLPFPESERIMNIGQQYHSDEIIAVGQPKFIFWREHAQSFDAMAIYQYVGSGLNLVGGNEPQAVSGIAVSQDIFKVLGVKPALGRPFTPEEDMPDGARVAILSDSLWKRNFAEDKNVVGKTISLNNKDYLIVGVMPQNFYFSTQLDVLVPLRPSLKGDPNPNLTVIGRLKNGITESQAQAEMKLIAEQYRAAFPNAMQPNETIGVQPYKEIFNNDATVKKFLWILLGAVGFLLLIACANVAHLQLTRATARKKEIAIRHSLGAGKWRVVRQLLLEGILLAIVGGVVGVLLAVWGTDLLVSIMPEGMISRTEEIAFDWRVLTFAFSTTILTGLLFGLAPALSASRVDLNTALKEDSGKGIAGAGRGRLRNVFIVAEIALSLVLLTGAFLLVRTFVKLQAVETGFDSHNVLTFQIAPNGERYDTAKKNSDFLQNVLGKLRTLPGVESAAVTTTLPLVAQFNFPVQLQSKPDVKGAQQFRMVTPEYFQTLKIGIQQGRAFGSADKAGAENVAIVNEAFAQKYFANANVLGEGLTVGRGFGDAQRQIVGVVKDVKQFGLDRKAPPMVYIPIEQAPDKMLLTVRNFLPLTFIVRVKGTNPLSLSSAVKHELASIDSTLPVDQISSMEEVVSQSVEPQRFNMLLIGIFASLGLLLAAVGIYGVISYSIAQRTHEIGIRMALGAKSSDVMKMVIRQGVWLAVIGVAIGLVASFGLTRLMQSLLFGVSPTDPFTFVLVSLVLVFVALAACLIPARKAAKTDPMVALRYE